MPQQNLPVLSQQKQDEVVELVIGDFKQIVVEKKDVSFWQKLFPTAAQKELAAHEVHVIQKVAKFKEEAFAIYHQFQCQVLRETYNTILMKGKADTRGNLTQFFEQKMRELSLTLMENAEEFLKETDEAFERLDQFKHDFIRETRRAMIEKSIATYVETTEALIQMFKNILTEVIKG